MKFEKVQEGIENYLVVTEVKQKDREEKIFTYQDIPGFLPLEIRMVNNEKEYWYNISGQISLADYWKEGNVTTTNVKNIFLQLLAMSDYLKQYLLDSSGAVFDEEVLYIHPTTLTVSGIYQPTLSRRGIKGIVRLLEDAIDIMGDTKEEYTMFYFYELHRQANIPGMTISSFQKVLENLPVSSDAEEEPSSLIIQRETPKRQISRKWNLKMEEEQRQLPVLSIGLLFAGIVIVGILWKTGMFVRAVSGETDWKMGMGASVFFLGVTAYGAWRTWPEEKKKLVSGTSYPSLCLIPCQGKVPMIDVTYFPFLLGKERGRVDGYIPAQGISPIHARLICEEEKMFLVDEESGNGSFCNEERMVPWEKKKLEDGDIVRFGQMEYVVEIT